MATIHAKFTQMRTDEDGRDRRVGAFMVEAEFEPGATVRESLANAREAAWREAMDAEALERERRGLR